MKRKTRQSLNSSKQLSLRHNISICMLHNESQINALAACKCWVHACACEYIYEQTHVCVQARYTLNLSSCLSSKNCQQPLADSTRHLQCLRHHCCFFPFRSLSIFLSLSVSLAQCRSNRPTQLLFQKADEIVPWSTAGPLDLTLKSEPAVEMFAYRL